MFDSSDDNVVLNTGHTAAAGMIVEKRYTDANGIQPERDIG
ncbi:MAG: hypothetical protein ACREEL_05885 [Stellaceae bacterium]